MTAPDTPHLPTVATLLRQHAADLCGDGCRAYHSAWGYLRLFDILPSVGRDHDALMEGLAVALSRQPRRILISGAADSGILAYVAAACSVASIEPEITIIDQCETPLRVIAWYAKQIGVRVECRKADALALADDDFDLIVAHSFLNFFSDGGRQTLARSWHQAMRRGAKALVIAQVKPAAPAKARRFGPEKARQLANKAREQWQTSVHRTLIPSDDLERLVDAFAEARTSYPLQTAGSLTEPFTANGFSVLRLEPYTESQGEVSGDHGGQRYWMLMERT